jgi:2-keto-4-pentenoate hydratase/2-oxohepta-3-ene-1,7-dioic acid hydratase in catechol pathway
VNGERRQDGGTDSMTFGLARLIRYLSGIFTLAPGDLIFTGTPAGVARFEHGDRLEAGLGPPREAPLCTLSVSALRDAEGTASPAPC